MSQRFPRGLPARYRKHWAAPWLPAAYRSLGFRRWLKRNGYLSPNFRTREAASKDGRKPPVRHRWRIRRHAFRLERIRHRIGDQPVAIVSWYRSPQRNAAVHGASKSRHMVGDATDHPKWWVDKHGGQKRLIALARKAGCKGIGRYPGGNLHFDDRAIAAEWTAW